jgi:hypothetical protein
MNLWSTWFENRAARAGCDYAGFIPLRTNAGQTPGSYQSTPPLLPSMRGGDRC